MDVTDVTGFRATLLRVFVSLRFDVSFDSVCLYRLTEVFTPLLLLKGSKADECSFIL